MKNNFVFSYLMSQILVICFVVQVSAAQFGNSQNENFASKQFEQTVNGRPDDYLDRSRKNTDRENNSPIPTSSYQSSSNAFAEFAKNFFQSRLFLFGTCFTLFCSVCCGFLAWSQNGSVLLGAVWFSANMVFLIGSLVIVLLTGIPGWYYSGLFLNVVCISTLSVIRTTNIGGNQKSKDRILGLGLAKPVNYDPNKFISNHKWDVDPQNTQQANPSNQICFFKCPRCKCGVKSNKSFLFKKLVCSSCNKEFLGSKAYGKNPSD